MFRWLAPLLLFAAKPDVLIRVVTAAIAAGVLVLGVWLISNIALTVDALKNPKIAAASPRAGPTTNRRAVAAARHSAAHRDREPAGRRDFQNLGARQSPRGAAT